ncbi:sulfatase [Aporhodopirellula aestuarii]|uniref:Sulfatase n=1 Tax=Aporhodopirellula aestuarii TaxID=2950107 RepID=A0ABT0U254_9BACT|nr:sulfatase [Aporhodopirellula aestuarii]MCM2370987.1 sulfatase [Aporhodopirellula aestuarii]
MRKITRPWRTFTQAVLLGILCCGLFVDANAAETKPNVVFILADDLGFSDTTLYGTTKFYRTPNMERLAARGMTFSRAYASSPLCSPTRSSILTGLSPARTDITAPVCHLPVARMKATQGDAAPPNKKAILPNSATRLDTKHYTLAEMFRDNGYATAHFGKWHLGPEPYSPLEHGFDVDIPHWPGPGPAGSYVAPWKYPDFDPQTPQEHIEDRMAEEAVAYMEAHRDEPFFLNYWMFSVHAPFDAKQKLIDKYKKRVDPNDPQRSPTYAAMIESMDDAVGTLIDALDRLGIADNTIVIFASDNGGNMYNAVDDSTATSNAPLRGGKATMYEGGVRGPGVVVYPGVVEPGSRSDEVIQSADFYPTLLELLKIEKQPEQLFDGISIVPALKGGKLQREGIYTYFPHSPGVPDWLPPAVSVHRGDWKLIRLFYNGENGKHRYKLYDLKHGLGETTDLAAQYPDIVMELDAMIEDFLVDTGAVLPRPNPNFDPSRYDPTLEGKATLKGGANKPTAKTKSKPAAPVAGWQPQGTCELSIDGDELVVESTGGDPHFYTALPESANAQQPSARSFTLRFTMTSNANDAGQVFWHEKGVAPSYFRDRSVPFSVTPDGKPHEYSIAFTSEHPVVGIRIDPATSAGVMRISDIRLTNQDGEIIHAWEF